jgi:hypothetical protein
MNFMVQWLRRTIRRQAEAAPALENPSKKIKRKNCRPFRKNKLNGHFSERNDSFLSNSTKNFYENGKITDKKNESAKFTKLC